MVVAKGEGVGEVEERVRSTVGEGELTLAGEHTVQHTDNITDCTLETYIILLTSVTLINLIKLIKIRTFVHSGG